MSPGRNVREARLPPPAEGEAAARPPRKGRGLGPPHPQKTMEGKWGSCYPSRGRGRSQSLLIKGAPPPYPTGGVGGEVMLPGVYAGWRHRGRCGVPLPSPDCPWLSAAPRAPLTRSLAAAAAVLLDGRRGRGGGSSFPSPTFSPALQAKPLSAPFPPTPLPDCRRLGRCRRLLGRGPSRPRRRRSPHCVSLTGSSPATPRRPPHGTGKRRHQRGTLPPPIAAPLHTRRRGFRLSAAGIPRLRITGGCSVQRKAGGTLRGREKGRSQWWVKKGVVGGTRSGRGFAASRAPFPPLPLLAVGAALQRAPVLRRGRARTPF